jgi:peptidoglycan LD-endopeptidase CwlK
MPAFGKTSLTRLSTCDERLQKIFNEVIKSIDCSILCGHRGEAEQNRLFAERKTKVIYPHSKHNTWPSKAVDVIPFPLKDWKNIELFKTLAAYIKAEAAVQGVKLRWGADWNMNGRTDDERFLDYPHWEIVE